MIERQLDFKFVNKILKDAKSRSISVGFDNTPHPKSKESLASIAAFNEDGTSTIPPRPFMKMAFVSNANFMTNIRVNGRKILRGELDSQQAMNLLKKEAVQAVKESIDNFDNPENADATIAKKGFNDPLIDTGFMRNNVRAKDVQS